MRPTLLAVAVVTLLGVKSQAQEAAADATASAPPQTTIERIDLGHRLGAGLIVGEPTGVSLKYFLNDEAAIDDAIGWGFHHETDLYLHSDFLWHWNDFYSVPEGRLSLYFGAGVRVKYRDNDDDRVGCAYRWACRIYSMTCRWTSFWKSRQSLISRHPSAVGSRLVSASGSGFDRSVNS